MTHGSDKSGNTSSGVRIFPPGVYLAGLVIGYAIEWFSPLPILPGANGAARVLGVIVLILGAGLLFGAVSRFRSVGTSPNPTEPTTALALDGPYRFTRNPMYLGMALLLAGFALIGNALWPLIAVIPVVFVIRTQVIDREERYLEAKFGAQYTDFKARVRRWL